MATELHISLRPGGTLSGQLYRQIRDRILEGRLRPGERLPSSRELADRIGVSRTTVVTVYERLRAEGFLEARTGAGTFISDKVRPREPAERIHSPLRPRAVWVDLPQTPDLSAVRTPYDLRPGIPDAGEFPFAAWRARITRQFRPRRVGKGTHIAPGGLPELRAAVARHVGVSRSVRASAEDIVITNGSQQALDLITRVLLDPGDTVAVEDPGYPLPRRAFRALGRPVVGVPVDAEGLVVDLIPDSARMVYVTPSHQYPLGMALSMERRQALLAWARRVDGVVVEDDYDSEFRFGGRPLETLHSLDGSGRVIYVGSFSKVLLPTLRLGFLVAPPSLHAGFRKAKQVADWHTAVPTQAAAAEFIEDGLFAQHIRRMRKIYEERHQVVVTTLEDQFDGHLAPLPTTSGLHLTALLPGGGERADTSVAERAEQEGVALLPLSYHFMTGSVRQGLLIGYGATSADRIGEALRRLRRCLET